MRRVELLMAVAILCIAGTVLDAWTAQPASRYLLTVAVVDDHTLTLDSNQHRLGIDHAVYEGHYYSDKAPYQPFLAAPFYQAFRAAGGNGFPAGELGTDDRSTFHWGRWWVGLWSSTVPAIALCILLQRLVRQVRPEVATPVALALSLGTMLLPFASALFGHMLSAALLAGAWLLVRRASVTAASMFAAGFLLSAAVGAEYPTVIPAAVVAVVALVAHGPFPTLALTAGGLVGAVPLMIYNWLAFDSPLSTSYQGHLPNFQGSGAFGVYNLVAPQLDELRKALVGDRGLLTLTPVCALAVGFAVLAITRCTRTRRDGCVALVVLGSMWLMSAGIDGYGGWSPGPRYLTTALPFLAIPLADAWARCPRVCAVAAILGAVPMVLATITGPLVETGYTRSVRLWLDLALDGDLVKSVPGEVVGDWGLYVLVLVGVVAALAAVRLDHPSFPDQRSTPTGARVEV